MMKIRFTRKEGIIQYYWLIENNHDLISFFLVRMREFRKPEVISKCAEFSAKLC